jgi:hypothetical protein
MSVYFTNIRATVMTKKSKLGLLQEGRKKRGFPSKYLFALFAFAVKHS